MDQREYSTTDFNDYVTGESDATRAKRRARESFDTVVLINGRNSLDAYEAWCRMRVVNRQYRTQ